MSRLSLCGVLALAPAPTLAPTCASAVAPEPSYSQMSSKAGMRSGKCFVARGYIYIYVYIHPYSRERLRGPQGGGGGAYIAGMGSQGLAGIPKAPCTHIVYT